MSKVNLLLLLFLFSGCKAQDIVKESFPEGKSFNISLRGNAFVEIEPFGAKVDRNFGLQNWTNPVSVTSVYFRIEKAGDFGLKVKAKASQNSTINVAVNNLSKEISLSGATVKDYTVGVFTVKEPGYVKVDLQGISKKGADFGEIAELVVVGDLTMNDILYSNDPEYYYWARRGPSCHLNYEIPTTDNVNYYYSEIVVPEGEDKIGSYFMANGFAEGYFGIQVNSETERRVLFSLWSPYNTDNPNEVPENDKIKLLKKGEGVYAGDFGNEGTGGQSYLKFPWKAGTSYKFLLKGEPDGKGATDYTAWFFAPEKGQWQLISSMKRPKINTYLKRFHGFLENFYDNNGYQRRKAIYKNHWIRTVSGEWKAVNKASFSVDNTYRAKQRIDAQGGVDAGGFYLENGGFFSSGVKPGDQFTINTSSTAKPLVDLDKLP